MSRQQIMGSNRFDDEEEDDDDPLPFYGISKSAVLQDCRCFNDISISVNKCVINMVKVLYLLNVGVNFTGIEATEVYFGSTKLFQNDDPKMRRLLFIFLKDLAPFADQAFFASSSLVKDIKESSEYSNKCNALRALRKVTDYSLINSVERFIEQAFANQNTNVVSAAMVTGINIAQTHPEFVRKWVVNVSNAIERHGNKVQYLALALLHKLRKNDRLSVLKLVQQAQNGSIRNSLALCVLIRMISQLLIEDFSNSIDLYKFLTLSMLHHSSDMVVIEAAHAICSLRNVSSKEVVPAILAIAPYLNSHKPTLRYTTIQMLSKVAVTHPGAVSSIINDIEVLVSDPNRNVATLAITTLLKIGNEFSIDRVLRQLTGPMMAELSDESKEVIVESMRVISVKFPNKYQILVEFLYSILRNDGGGAEFKQSVVETMVFISRTNPAAKEYVLVVLSKFIEDCEFVNLVRRVLCLIGDEGPYTSKPSQYIRYICNHVQLESPLIRAVAITTLAKFGAAVPALRRSIKMLLKRPIRDPDDEVRDRALFYYLLFKSKDEVAIRALVSDVTAAVTKERIALIPMSEITRDAEEAAARIAAAVAGSGCTDIGKKGAGFGGVEGDSSSLGIGGGGLLLAQTSGPSNGSPFGGNINLNNNENSLTTVVLGLRDKLRAQPQLRALGEPINTAELVPLTEQDNEYVVSVAKHIFPAHIVLQFKVLNTIPGASLVKFNILANTEEVEGGEITPLYSIPIDLIRPNATAYAYVVFQHQEKTFPNGIIKCGCSFAMKEEDENNQGGDDNFDVSAEIGDVEEFPIDEFALNICDYIIPFNLGNSFETQWTSLRNEETVDTYSLKTMSSLTQAAHAIIDFFGMNVEGGRPEKITVKSYTINMSGIIADSSRTLMLISAKVYVTADNTIALQLSLRGGDQDLRNFLSNALIS